MIYYLKFSPILIMLVDLKRRSLVKTSTHWLCFQLNGTDGSLGVITGHLSEEILLSKQK